MLATPEKQMILEKIVDEETAKIPDKSEGTLVNELMKLEHFRRYTLATLVIAEKVILAPNLRAATLMSILSGDRAEPIKMLLTVDTLVDQLTVLFEMGYRAAKEGL